MKRVKLFEGFIQDLESQKINEGNQPSDYPGKFNAETAKANGEKWNGLDKWGYPLYTGESAVKLKEFLKNSLTNGEATIVELKSGRKILVAKHTNGLYYYLKDVEIEEIEEEVPPTKEEVTKVIDPVEVEPQPIPEVITEPIAKFTPLKIWRKGSRSTYKSKEPRAEGRRKFDVGSHGSSIKLGYKEEINGDSIIYFNGLNDMSYSYNPISKEVKTLSPEEKNSTKLSNSKKYKSPKDKREFKEWLKKHEINL
jgi:hypothetical protein